MLSSILSAVPIEPREWQATVASALACHAIFNRLEPSPWVIVFMYPLGWSAWLYYALTLKHLTVFQSLLSTVSLSSLFTAVLLTSIAAYRAFFHRLVKFPGPRSLALSKWFCVPMDAKGKRPAHITAMHAKYGDVVRVGPRELSINDPTVISAVLGGQSKMIKGPWYTMAHGGKPPRCLSLHVTINPKDQRIRRRIWDQAFSVRALSGYEDELRHTTHAVMMQLQRQAGKKASGRIEPTKVDEWCMFYSFDIMGLLGFSRSFDMVGAGRFSNEAALLHGFVSTIMILANVPYMAQFARVLPNPLQEFEDYTAKALDERREKKTDGSVKDIFSYLIDEDQETGWKHTWMELNADAGLVVVAGSDTSSTTLTMSLFNLTKKKECFLKLRQEIQSVFGKDVDPDTIIDFTSLAKDCPYLDAVIHESLRLFPPVASGLQRETKSETVVTLRNKEQIILPANTLVSMATTTMQRDPRNFSPLPNEFRPERWIDSAKEEVFNRQAFIPFGFGPTGCVGRQLAMMEMRIFLAQFVMRFDVDFAPQFDEQAFLRGIRDTFTMSRDQHLLVNLTARRPSV